MYYILLQLETKGTGVNCQPKGSIWSTSWKKNDFRNGDSPEKFLEREKSEILKKVRSYKDISNLMNKWHNHCRKIEKCDFDTIRIFFKGKDHEKSTTVD